MKTTIMTTYFLIAFTIFASTVTSLRATEENQRECEFVILITSYNNEKYAEANLESACWQESTNPYQIIYINDCSTDKTAEIVDAYIQRNSLEDRVQVIHNRQRVGAMANIYSAIHSLIDDHKVVISLDGDDTLASNDTLTILESYYADPTIWMTYGTALIVPQGKTQKTVSQQIPLWVLNERKLRQHTWMSSHLRTFKAGLFKEVKKEDFFYKEAFMEVTWDMAFMLPMLEMCSPQNISDKNHSSYVKEILYHYRMDNPINDFRIKLNYQEEVEQYVRNKEPYEPIKELT